MKRKFNFVRKSLVFLKEKLTGARLLRLEAAIAVGLIAAIFITGAVAVLEQREIASKLIRLHITAQSDAAGDQALKLAVRDRLLSELGPELEKMTSCKEAFAFFSGSLEQIKADAAEVITANGYDYGVDANLIVETFPEREYGDITLPAGEYTTLRVTIGSGEGANWWCVMFPPLCSFASAKKTDGSYYSFSSGEWSTITNHSADIVIKFKVLEIFSVIKSWFK